MSGLRRSLGAQFAVKQCQTFGSAHIFPAPAMVLTAHLVIRHRRTQQWGQFGRLADDQIFEQAGAVEADASKGEGGCAIASFITDSALSEYEVASRVLYRIVNQHKMSQVSGIQPHRPQGIIAINIAVDDQKRIIVAGIQMRQSLPDAASRFKCTNRFW